MPDPAEQAGGGRRPSAARNVELDPGADRVRAMLGPPCSSTATTRRRLKTETTLRSSPDLHEARFNLGFALEKLGRAQEAIDQYQACLDQLPDFEPARKRLQILRKR